jgi:hypothetical protein
MRSVLVYAPSGMSYVTSKDNFLIQGSIGGYREIRVSYILLNGMWTGESYRVIAWYSYYSSPIGKI